MKIHCYILALIVIAVSCQSPQEDNSAVQSDIREDTATESKTIKEDASIQDERSNWQKPEYIIKSLGDLEGKTLADIGSGALGYFVFKLLGQTDIEKVIAIDIDNQAVSMLNVLRDALDPVKAAKLDIRLADVNDPKLKTNEVDYILIVNTVAYLPDRISYFKNLRPTLKEGGKIVIVDFKIKRIPDYVEAPPYEERVYLNIIEEELYGSGYSNIVTNDTALEYQYFITAEK